MSERARKHATSAQACRGEQQGGCEAARIAPAAPAAAVTTSPAISTAHSVPGASCRQAGAGASLVGTVSAVNGLCCVVLRCCSSERAPSCMLLPQLLSKHRLEHCQGPVVALLLSVLCSALSVASFLERGGPFRLNE